MRMTKTHGKKQHKQILLAVLLMCCVAFTTLYSGIAYAASGNNYDTTPPVLEGVTFVQQGQTVSVNDELEVDVQCYDAESDIQYIGLYVYHSLANGSATGTELRFYPTRDDDSDSYNHTYTYDEDTGTATLKFSLEDIGDKWTAPSMYFDTVKIVDTYGNVLTKNYDTTTYTCTVSDYSKVDGETPDTDDHKYVYLNATYSVDKSTLSKEGDIAHITVALPEGVETSFDETTSYTAYLYSKEMDEDGLYSVSIDGSYSRILMTYNSSKNVFEGDLVWNPYMANGTLGMSIYDSRNSIWTNSTTYYLYDQTAWGQAVNIKIENATSTDFSLTAVKTKTSAITQDGYYSEGDTVAYSIPANGREKLYTMGYLYLSPVASAELSSSYVELEYNKETDCYEGIFTIADDTYPCEWRVNSIDFSGHDDDQWCNLSFDPTNKAYCYDDNYYFSVMQKNTFSAATGSVNLTIRYVDENNVWQTVIVSKDNITSRQMTYEDLLEANSKSVDFEAIESKTGYKLEGFRDNYSYMMNGSSGNDLVTLDTPIVFNSNNGSYTTILTAKYEGVEFLDINKSYLTQCGGSGTGNNYMMTYEPDTMVAVKDDITIGQAINDYVASPKALDGITFTGWSLRNGYNSSNLTADTKVSDYVKNYFYGSPSVSIIANYDKKVVSINYSYVGQNVSTRMYYTASAVLDDGATYADAIEMLKKTDVYKNATHDPKLTVEGVEIKNAFAVYDPETGTYTYKTIDPETKITEPISYVYMDTTYDKYKVTLMVTETDNVYGMYTRSEVFYVDKDSDSEYSLPDTITDYKDITWKYYSGNRMMSVSLNGKTSIPLASDVQVYGTGIYTGERYTDPVYSPVYSPTYSPEVDDEDPTASIIIGKNTYDTLAKKADITYKTYLTNEDEITIAADDNTGISGIMYCVRTSPVDDGSFDSLDKMVSTMGKGFSMYSEPFTINDDGNYVIYAVVLDKSYNYTVVSTNGIVVDSTAPKITGVEDGKTYNGETSFAVVDDNLSKVYINGKEVTANNGTYTLAVKDQEKQTIKAVDKAGNETSISVYVNNKPHEHSYVSQIVSPEYLATEATCTKAATYYYACSCGAKSDATYTYGEALGHDFSSEYTVDKEATVDEMGYASRHCSRCDETTGGYSIPKRVINTVTNEVVITNSETTEPTTTRSTVSQIAALTNTMTTEQTVAEEKPVVKMAEEKIVETVAAIAEAKAGDKVKVEMNGATVVSKEILKEAKEKGVDVVLQMDGYSWTIDAKDIKGMNLEDINLEVNLHADAIPSKQLSKLAGDNPVTQISLTHEGNFGFAATLSFNLGSEYKDKFGNLYWYDSTGKMIFIDSGLIDEDGNVSLTFSHASDYAIVMKDTDDAETIAAADAGSDSAVASTNETGYVASNHTVLWVVVIIVVALVIVGAVTFTRKRRK